MIEPITTSMGKGDNLLFRMKNRLSFFLHNKNTDWKDIPVIINNFNRLDCLQSQLAWLENAGMKNICIIDNNSTYPPLLDFYKKSKYRVFRLNENVGYDAPWKTIIFQRFRNSFYVYTDPDILPDEDCPPNAVEHFMAILNLYPAVDKVGFGLKIDDIPAHYPLKEKAVGWEQQYWEKPVGPAIYEAPIDTTFALYRPGARGGSELKALRTGGTYVARHLSWYQDPANLSEEEKFYQDTAGISGSWTAALTGKEAYITY